MNRDRLAIGGDRLFILPLVEKSMAQAVLRDRVVGSEFDSLLKSRLGFAIFALRFKSCTEVVERISVVRLKFERFTECFDRCLIFLSLKVSQPLLIKLGGLRLWLVLGLRHRRLRYGGAEQQGEDRRYFERNPESAATPISFIFCDLHCELKRDLKTEFYNEPL